MFRNILLFILVSLISISLPSSTFAQTYLFEKGSNNSFSNAQAISLSASAVEVHGFLSAGKETVDYYHLSPSEFSRQVKIELLVADTQIEFHPSLIFVEPNQKNMVGDVPFGFPVGAGGRVYRWPETGVTTIKDKQLFETYMIGPGLIKDLASHTYTLAVFNPEGVSGRYVLRITPQDAKAQSDFFNRLLTIIRVKLKLY